MQCNAKQCRSAIDLQLMEKFNKGAIIKNGTEGGGRDFKIHCEIMKPNARNRNYLHSPLTSAKNDLMAQGLQNELCGSETSPRKAFALYS